MQKRGGRAALLNGVRQASRVASEREPASAGYFRLRGDGLRVQPVQVAFGGAFMVSGGGQIKGGAGGGAGGGP